MDLLLIRYWILRIRVMVVGAVLKEAQRELEGLGERLELAELDRC